MTEPSPPYAPEDFLFGTEKACQQNRGNVLLKKLVLKYFEEYEAADQKTAQLDIGKKKSRKDISKIILDEIKSTGARFLKRSMSGAWEEVSHAMAQQKVMQGFKNRRRKMHNRSTRRAEVSPRSGVLKNDVLVAKTHVPSASYVCAVQQHPKGHDTAFGKPTQVPCPGIRCKNGFTLKGEGPENRNSIDHNSADLTPQPAGSVTDTAHCNPEMLDVESLSIQISHLSADSSTRRCLNHAFSVAGYNDSWREGLQTVGTTGQQKVLREPVGSISHSNQPLAKLLKRSREHLPVETEVAETLANLSAMAISEQRSPPSSSDSIERKATTMSSVVLQVNPLPDNMLVKMRLGEEVISTMPSVDGLDCECSDVDIDALLDKMKMSLDDRQSLIKMFGDLNVLLWTGENDEKHGIQLNSVLETVTQAMVQHQSDSQLQVYACTALTELPVLDESKSQACDPLLMKAGIDAVVKAMNNHLQTENVQAFGIQALGNFARLQSQNLTHIESSGGIEAILRAMKRYVSTECRRSSETVQSNGCNVLKMLAPLRSFKICQLGGISTVCGAMYDHSSLIHVQTDGCNILRELTDTSPVSIDGSARVGFRLSRREADLAQTVTKNAMEAHASHDQIQMDGKEVLMSLDCGGYDEASCHYAQPRTVEAADSEDSILDSSTDLRSQHLNQPQPFVSNEGIDGVSRGSDETTVVSNRSSTTLASVASVASLVTTSGERVPAGSSTSGMNAQQMRADEVESSEAKVELEDLLDTGHFELTFF